MIKPRIFIIGMIYNQIDHIKDIIHSHKKYVDGFSFCDHFSNDGTYEILKENEGAGKTVRCTWVQRHDLSSNLALHASASALCGDWVMYLDAQQRYTNTFLQSLRENIDIWEKNDISCIWWGRPWVFKYNQDQNFYGSPHYGLKPIRGKILNFQDESRVRSVGEDDYWADFMISHKRKIPNALINPFKYTFCYEYSNHFVLLYHHYGEEVWRFHEIERLKFLSYWKYELKRQNTLEDIESYFKEKQYSKYFIDTVEREVSFKDFFRVKILNLTWQEIVRNRHDWSFIRYLETGEIDQDPEETGYEGIITTYEKRQKH